MCKTYSIIQFMSFFYKFLSVENKKITVEKIKVINTLKSGKKGWKNLSTLNHIYIFFFVHNMWLTFYK